MASNSEKMRITVREVTSVADLRNEDLLGIHSCSQSAFQTDRGVAVDDIIQRLERGGTLYLAEGDTTIQAFATQMVGTPGELLEADAGSGLTEFPEAHIRGVFLADSAVRKEVQGKGLYKLLTRLRVRSAIDHRLPMVYVTTQNPRVAAGIKHAIIHFGERGEIDGAEVKALGFSSIAGGQLVTDERQVSRSQELNDFFGRINQDQGGAYLMFFKLVYPSASASSKIPSRVE